MKRQKVKNGVDREVRMIFLPIMKVVCEVTGPDITPETSLIHKQWLICSNATANLLERRKMASSTTSWVSIRDERLMTSGYRHERETDKESFLIDPSSTTLRYARRRLI